MCRFLNLSCLFILVTWNATAVFAQSQTTNSLAIQQGHSADIELVAISPSALYFATYGADQALIVWDYKTGAQMAKHPCQNRIEAIAFETDLLILMQEETNSQTLVLNIEDMQVTEGHRRTIRTKNSAKDDVNQVEISGSKVTLKNISSGKKTKRTGDYSDQEFTSICFSVDGSYIFIACEDGLVYRFGKDLKNLNQFKGHNSGVTDIAVTPDGRYLISVSRDRSIIKWEVHNGELVARYTGKSFALFGLAISNDGRTMTFGDDVGFLKELRITPTNFEISSVRKSLYPIQYTYQLNDTTILYGGKNNGLFIDQTNKIKCVYRPVKIHPKRLREFMFSSLFKFYRKPYTSIYSVAEFPKTSSFAISNSFTTVFPDAHTKLINLSNVNSVVSSKRFFEVEEYHDQLVCWMNDSTIVTTHSKTDLTIWRFEPSGFGKIFNKLVPSTSEINSLCSWTDSSIVVSSGEWLRVYCEPRGWIDSLRVPPVLKLFSLDDGYIVTSHVTGEFRTMKTGEGFVTFKGHTEPITAVRLDTNMHHLISASLDGTLRIWNQFTGELKATFVPIGQSNFICVTPDNYYMTSGKDLRSFGFKMNEQFVFPEQFDPFYNRPDIVMERLGYHNQELIDGYRNAHGKRMKRLGFSSSEMTADLNLPKLEVKNIGALPTSTSKQELVIELLMSDARFKLDRYSIWINGVPIYGSRGFSLSNNHSARIEQNAQINLSKGPNKIEISCTNSNGAESFREAFFIRYDPVEEYIGKTYFIGLGVDHFLQPGHDLKFSVKDIQDLTSIFEKKLGKRLIIDTLFNQSVSLKNLNVIKEKLAKTNIEDRVILAYSGHGLLDSQLDYYLSTFEVDFFAPQEKGIPYNVLEDLLDSISARQKLLLIDACHSGEVDKEDLSVGQLIAGAKGIQRTRGVIPDSSIVQPKIGLQNSFQLMQELFVNVEKGSGATIISAAGGDEYALEGGSITNGFFTYALLQFFKENKTVSVKEMKKFVCSEVLRLSGGLQRPTSRMENTDLNWDLW
jgi:WD40 repeat protein